MESQKIINLLESRIAEKKIKNHQKDGTLLMIKTLVIMLMVMEKMVLQLNTKLK